MQLRRLAATTTLIAACACGSNASSDVPAPTSGPPTTSATSTPTTSPPTTPATTATSVAAEAAPQPSPEVAAAALLDAWRRQDRTTALRVASAGAVNALFAQAPVPTEARGCQQPVGPAADCAYGLPGSRLLALHTVAVGSEWVVDSITFEG